MSIRFNTLKCVGCLKCTDVCPGSLIKVDKTTNKPYIKYPDNCWGCTSCLKECRFDSIEFFLGADIGGNGSYMTVKQDENFIRWKITNPYGEVKNIDINRNESNKY